eukprot:3995091-Alexandrium_andersonii.AAC.1
MVRLLRAGGAREGPATTPSYKRFGRVWTRWLIVPGARANSGPGCFYACAFSAVATALASMHVASLRQSSCSVILATPSLDTPPTTYRRCEASQLSPAVANLHPATSIAQSVCPAVATAHSVCPA